MIKSLLIHERRSRIGTHRPGLWGGKGMVILRGAIAR